jgi:hypothetical protein
LCGDCRYRHSRFFIAQETKALLIGERASRAMRDAMLAVARTVHGVMVVDDLFTVHLSPTQIVIASRC